MRLNAKAKWIYIGLSGHSQRDIAAEETDDDAAVKVNDGYIRANYFKQFPTKNNKPLDCLLSAI